MIIGSISENKDIEKRISITPDLAKKYISYGFEILIEKDFASHLDISNEEFINEGCKLEKKENILKQSDIILQLNLPEESSFEHFKENNVLIGNFNCNENKEVINKYNKKKTSIFSLELLPRITRAQSMDILSSQANLAGYKAVVDSFAFFKKAIPMMMTAAGTISAAKVLVIGAGVAGLQAIATAKRLGARVKAFDTRPIVKEQVESLGAEFVSLETSDEAQTSGGYAEEMSEDFYQHEHAIIGEHLPTTDAVITTAQIFGKRAPLLITEEMLQTMRYGSVIVDLAAEQGGNCELTVPGKNVERHGVNILSPLDLPSSLSYHTSEMFSRNVTALLSEMLDAGEMNIDLEDEVVSGTILTHEGKILNQHVIDLLDREKEEN